MKPISLKLQAFGAFAKPVSLDFSVFDKHRLFLIHGQTGAGKTTLFDGMCYALYGEATYRDAAKMRSQFADSQTDTIVEFIFRMRDRLYRIERRVYVVKQRKKETPETDNAEEVKLDTKQVFSEIDAAGNPLGEILTKIRDIDEKVREIVGFSAEQFKQIVILPQGKFDELIRASSDEKMPILKEIFDAYIFEKITEKLIENRKTYEKQLENITQQITFHLRSAGLSKEEEEDILLQQITELEAQMPDFNKELTAKEEIFKQSLAAFEQVKAIASDFLEYEKISQTLSVHLQTENQIVAQQKVLADAEKAEKLRQPIENLHELEKQIAETQRQITEDEKSWKETQVKLKEVEDEARKIKTLEENLDKIKQKIQKYTELKPKTQEISRLERELQNIESLGITKRKDREKAEAELKGFTDKLAEMEIREKQLEPLARQKSGLEVIWQDWQKLQTKHKKLLEITSNLQDFEFDMKQKLRISDEANSLRQQKETEYNWYDRVWRDSQAASFASQLTDNQPCPVCGSLHHPHPALPTDQTVTDLELENARMVAEKARFAYEKAQQDYVKARENFASQQVSVKALQEEIGEKYNLSLKSFEAEVQKHEQAYRKAEEAENELNKIAETTQRTKLYIENTEKQRKSLDAEVSGLREKYSVTKEKLKLLQQEMPENLNSESLLETEIQKLTTEKEETESYIRQIEKAREDERSRADMLKGSLDRNRKNLEENQKEVSKRRIYVQELLLKNNFYATEDVKGLLKTENEIKALKAEIENWNLKKVQIETQQKTYLIKLEGKVRPDIESSEQKKNENEHLLKEYQTFVNQKNTLLSQLRKAWQEIENLKAGSKKMHEDFSHIKLLADIANGRNPVKQKFEAYVLSVFLDEVLQYANKRLDLLSQGRYQLLIKTGFTGGGKDTSLDLEVFDSYNNKKRDVQSLSGGETFFTSLALALGLADVATARAGGLKLDAIFIDEGFGTLDSETLDLAIRTLTNLDGEHRLVGIISHITELKERISGRLEVIKDKSGSYLQVVA
jgi:exonuclease SbcC